MVLNRSWGYINSLKEIIDAACAVSPNNQIEKQNIKSVIEADKHYLLLPDWGKMYVTGYLDGKMK